MIDIFIDFSMIDQPTKMSQFGGLEKLEKWPMPCSLFVDPTMVLVCHEGRLRHTLDSPIGYTRPGTHTKNHGKSPCSMGKLDIYGYFQ
jgi:hypothetical protein